MAYAKLIKVCQDFGLGIQQVNQAQANLEEFYADWAEEHGSQPPSFLSSPYESLGRHNTPLIPRAMIDVKLGAGLGGATTVTLLALDPTVRSIHHLAAGVWFFAMAQPLTRFMSNPVCKQTSNSVTRFGTSQPGVGLGTANGLSGFTVFTYDLVGGAFGEADLDFSCAVYAYF